MWRILSFTPEELIQIRNKIKEARRNGGDSAETTKAIREIIRQWRQQLKTREDDNEDAHPSADTSGPRPNEETCALGYRFLYGQRLH